MFLRCLSNKQSNTWLPGGVEFLLECSTRYLSLSLHSPVGYRDEHSKRNWMYRSVFKNSNIYKLLMGFTQFFIPFVGNEQKRVFVFRPYESFLHLCNLRRSLRTVLLLGLWRPVSNYLYHKKETIGEWVFVFFLTQNFYRQSIYIGQQFLHH